MNPWRIKSSESILALAILLGLGFSSSGLAQEQIRVLTFNLRYASAYDGANNWINTNQIPERRAVAAGIINGKLPDIVGLQEGEAAQLDYLQSAVSNFYAFVRQGPSGGSGNENAAFGYNVNRIRLLDHGVISLGNSPGGGYWNNVPGTPFNPWDLFPENNFAFPRLALWARLEWRATGQQFLFTTTHFDTFNTNNAGESQWKSARLIVDNVWNRNARMPRSPLAIVVGDFNGSQNDRAWKLFKGSLTNNGIAGDFRDAWEETRGGFANAGTIHNFSGGTPPGSDRIDWVLFRGGFSATSAEIVTNRTQASVLSPPSTRTQYPSDHYPFFAVLNFPALQADFDRDGLPDALEQASPLSSPTVADSDGDGLLDGEEDLDGDGSVDGGETDPSNGTDVQKPTDIRNFQMDGRTDFQTALWASHGLNLFGAFDGRYLYVATQDAGEGNDHFIFVTTNPTAAVNMPWAKAGQVAAWDAFLADENDGGFAGWFDRNKAQITNLFAARAATYYQNDGRLEGVLDLAAIYGAGFTQTVYVAAGPYGTADGGNLYPPSQVPEGNGDGNLVGAAEFFAFNGDADGDGINDAADPDRDGDQMPDAWETAWGLDPDSGSGTNGPTGDIDEDGMENLGEYRAGFDPRNADSVLRLNPLAFPTEQIALSWTGLQSRIYHVEQASGSGLAAGSWTQKVQASSATGFPFVTLQVLQAATNSPIYFRLQSH
jgi:endonuclease/exonuclease/phosphatase family metal-dependent hydrolase